MHGILILIVLGFGFYKAIQKFNAHCDAKFGQVIYTTKSFVAVTMATGAIYGGVLYQQHTTTYHLGSSDGLGLILIGIGTLAYLAWKNIKRTNLAYGIVATGVQVPLSIIIAPVIMLILFMLCFGYGALSTALSAPSTVRIIR